MYSGAREKLNEDLSNAAGSEDHCRIAQAQRRAPNGVKSSYHRVRNEATSIERNRIRQDKEIFRGALEIFGKSARAEYAQDSSDVGALLGSAGPAIGALIAGKEKMRNYAIA
jgi:hypothetical protein